jgi:hypothetical protein
MRCGLRLASGKCGARQRGLDRNTPGALGELALAGANLSPLSHRLVRQHRTRAPALDVRWILTCGCGFRRTRRTLGTDLRIKWSPICGRRTGFLQQRYGRVVTIGSPYVFSDRLRRLKL